MFDKTIIFFCGNIMLKSVKMHFFGNTEILGFKKFLFYTWFRIHFGFQTGTLEIVKNHFS